jgi:PQQ-like domain
MGARSRVFRTLAIVVSSALVLGVSTSTVGAAPQGRKVLWKALYNGPLGSDAIDEAEAVAVSPDGATVFVTGRSDSIHYNDYATIAYDAATGTQRWLARYDGPGQFMDIAYAVAASPDGSTVFITGSSGGSDDTDDVATIAYDSATGAQRWLARYDGPGTGDDSAFDLAVSPDGTTVFVGGESNGVATADDATTIAYDAISGTQRWVARYNGSGNSYDAVNALALSPDGSSVYVTGTSIGMTTSNDLLTIAYRASDGSPVWLARYDGPAADQDSARGLAVAPDGTRVFVAGQSDGVGSSDDYATVSYDAAQGTQLWVARYNGPGNDFDAAEALGISPDGSSVFVTGQSQGAGTFLDYATIAYDSSTGAQRWLARMDYRHSLDRAWALEVSPSGATVFVTGEGFSSTVATVAYNASTGSQRWGSSAGPVLSAGNDLALAPDGSAVFVAGLGPTQNSLDYITVAIPA